jgi:hypothetical protein
MDPERLQRLVTVSLTANIELMTHPALQEEFDLLISRQFGDIISATRLASYRALKDAS